MKRALTLVLVALVPSLASAEVMPHRALYTMSLDEAKPSSGVAGATGSLGYQWGETCDGWTIEQRYKLTMQYEEEQPVTIGSSFVTWESKDGLRYRFNEKKTRNGQIDEEIRGEAKLDPKTHAGSATFVKPKDQVFDLPAGTFFPTAHTLELIKLGQKGTNYLSARVFDGSTVDGAVLIGAVIGATLKPGVDLPAPFAKRPLLDHPSWNTRLAFFPDAESEERPDYEQAMRLFDDGVSSEMTIDYGDYVIRATLKALEPLPRPAC
jgi:hypothetical protein